MFRVRHSIKEDRYAD